MPLQECLLIQQVRNVQPMHDCTIARRPLWLQAMLRMLVLLQIRKLQSIQDKILMHNYLLLVQPLLFQLCSISIPSAVSTSISSTETRTTSCKQYKECPMLSVAVFNKCTFKVFAWNRKSRDEAHRGKVVGPFQSLG